MIQVGEMFRLSTGKIVAKFSAFSKSVQYESVDSMVAQRETSIVTYGSGTNI